MLERTVQLALTYIVFLGSVTSNCVYTIDEHLMPQYVKQADSEPFLLSNLNACKDYLEPARLGCCNKFNDQITFKNFKQIDGLFGAQGGGCDICAINLKRFWCQYACSSRQSQFMDVSKEYEPFPDPQKPGSTIFGQRVSIRVHSQTACSIFSSCKLNPFVAAVSAMSNPAGFLNFQGHNAINDGHQYISMNFSYVLNDSLAFSDELNDFPNAQLTSYQSSSPELHNFTVNENCSCNSCEELCESNGGFSYSESSVSRGSYVAVLMITVGLTAYRKWQMNRKVKNI